MYAEFCNRLDQWFWHAVNGPQQYSGSVEEGLLLVGTSPIHLLVGGGAAWCALSVVAPFLCAVR